MITKAKLRQKMREHPRPLPNTGGEGLQLHLKAHLQKGPVALFASLEHEISTDFVDQFLRETEFSVPFRELSPDLKEVPCNFI